jgi:hypothetical protein
MGEVVALNVRHPLVGTWRDEDPDGSFLRFVVRPAGSGFDVRAVDTSDGEEIEISKVRWDGRVLRFTAFAPSSGRLSDYEMKAVSPSEISLRLSYAESWVRESD